MSSFWCPSSVGKTRCAYESVRAVLSDWWLIHPVSSDDLAALGSNPPGRTVVWLVLRVWWKG